MPRGFESHALRAFLPIATKGSSDTMSELRDRSRSARRAPGVARHGQLKRSNPATLLLKIVGAALAVVLFSGASVAAITYWRLTGQIKANSVELIGETDGPPPQIGKIPGGFNILIVGSDSREGQAGIGLATLASDPALVDRFNITHVMTYGAPIDHVDVDPRVQVMQINHGWDWIPKLDFAGVRTDGLPTYSPSVTLDSPGLPWQGGVNHSFVEYYQSVRDSLGSDTAEGRMLRDYQSGLGAFLVGPGDSATAVDIPVSRGGRP